jgi:hypothetical protein
MRNMKQFGGLFMMFIFLWSTAFSQSDEAVSDADLKQFADAFMQVQEVDQQAQQEMVTAVMDKGMTVERFNELFQAQQNPAQEADATEEELSNYDEVMDEIMTIQENTQAEMEEKITDAGLTIDRYQEINLALQSSPELQQKLMEHLQLD